MTPCHLLLVDESLSIREDWRAEAGLDEVDAILPEEQLL